MERVSFVIPTYNRVDHLRECVASIRAQGVTDVEIIVVDDASTQDICQFLAREPAFSGVVFLRHPENRGPGEARNTGIRAAKGRYVAFLDDDDLLDPCFLETAMGAFTRDPSISLFCCDAFLIGQSGAVLYGGRTFHQINAVIKRYAIGSGPRSVEDIFLFSTIGIGFVVKREVFDRVRYPCTRRMEDYEFQIRVAGNGFKVYYHHEPLARYRMHEGNESGARWMVRMCEQKVACLQEALNTYQALQHLGWRARRRMADARMDLAIAYFKEARYRLGILMLCRAVAGDPAQLVVLTRLAGSWLAKRILHQLRADTA